MNKQQAAKIVICGPTASGKSRLALELALKLNGVIINFDSQQLYKELPIITAQPSAAEKQLVPHYLYGVISGKEPASVASWLAMALKIIEEIPPERAIIFVGGSGLYLNALLNGLSAIPEIPSEIRTMVRGMSLAEVALELGVNSVNADRNSHRMRRRLEVKIFTGKDIEEFHGLITDHPFKPLDLKIYNLNVSRETIYAAINSRLDFMLINGALDEIKTLYGNSSYPLELQVMKACGAKELMAYFKGELSYEQAIDKAKQSTRNYAKRQMTWFRHKLPEHKVDLENISVDLILKDLENNYHESIFKPG